ncbi:localization factor PodJL [Angulomicrobium tetraedrale]|uniref:Localization factor PodJL n=1 Tax=Ancylobacter tetraedralis TaxID=217068 RepID=A0A839ZEJ5_9HYPH|nr:localization factor PodJL [Ancylobacter tetraedralis]
MRQRVPSLSGQIAPEAWRAMSDAARRAGLPLDEWLKAQLIASNAGVAQTAAASGGSVEDLQRRVEELSGAIDRLVDSAPSAIRQAEPPAPTNRRAPSPPRSAALAATDGRIDAAIRQINERLDALNTPRASARQHTTVPAGEDISRPAEAVARRDDPPAATDAPPRRRERPVPAAHSPQAIEAAIAEIAARQQQLDQAAGTRPPRPIPPLARGEEPVPGPSPLFAPLPERPAARHPMKADPLDAIQHELGEMRQTIADLAPRQAIDELQRTMMRLADRAERTRAGDDDMRATLLALRDMIGNLKRPEHPGVLITRVEQLERKIDIVNAKTVDGAAIARLQAQAGEIRELLARALSTDALQRLAEQVALLAGRIGQIPRVDETTLQAAVAPLERRIDALVERIDRRPEPVVPVDDILGRLDALQKELASARREPPAGMEHLFRGMAERLERIERPIQLPDHGPRFDALSRQVAEIAQKLDHAATPAAQITGQLSTIERAVNDLFIHMEETRATLLATSGNRPHPTGGGGGSGGAGAGLGDAHALLKREIAAIEAARASARPPHANTAPSSPALRNPDAPAHAVIPAKPVRQAGPQPSFTPPPASIPKPFEPQLMRAALEELARSPQVATAYAAPPAYQPADDETATYAPEEALQEALHETPQEALHETPQDASGQAPKPAPEKTRLMPGALGDAFDLPGAPEVRAPHGPVGSPGAAAGQPGRAHFIAQARRATQPGTRDRADPAGRHGERGSPAARNTARWAARIRAMLLIGACGSALAYGSWHVLGTMREGQLRAGAPVPAGSQPTLARPGASSLPPGAAPLPDDITGSIGNGPRGAPAGPPSALPMPAVPPATPSQTAPTQAAPNQAAPNQAAPNLAPGPSSMAGPEDLPLAIGSQGLRSAALSGDAGAAFEVANRFQQGMGVPPSAARAAQWFAFAADCGSIPAAYRLGALYEKGAEGVPRDLARARTLYEQAARAGNLHAMHNLGVLLASGTNGPPDYAQAAAWFTSAAEHGLRDSQFNLAILYARGFGVVADPVQAWRWFALAAAAGDAQAAAKRDAIGVMLDPKSLAAARLAVQGWTPVMADARANEGTGPEAGKAADPAATVPRKTALR